MPRMQEPWEILGEVRTVTRRARWWRIGAVVAIVAAGALIALLVRGSSAPHRARPPARAVVALDVARFRAHVAARRHDAQQLTARGRPTARHADLDEPPGVRLTRLMIEPQCVIGPAALCALLTEPVDACAEGDARACLALGQYLEDAPPYPMAVLFFYLHGCNLGDAEACARLQAIKGVGLDDEVDCDTDLLACTYRAARARDLVVLDRLCTRGVADACAVVAGEHLDEPATMHAYLAAGCQVGGSPACDELARRLAPDCHGDCFAPDPAQAAVAAALACEAGFTAHCAPSAR